MITASKHVNKRAPGYQKERGERQEARIIDALTDGPKTCYELADILHIARWTVHKYLVRLMDKANKLIHVCGFRLNGGRPMYLYDIGNKRNATLETFQRRRILKVLESIGKPTSTAQIAVILGESYGTINRYMNSLKKKNHAHIAEWEWSYKTPVGLYLAGKGEDAPRPTKWPDARPTKRAIPRSSIFAALGL